MSLRETTHSGQGWALHTLIALVTCSDAAEMERCDQAGQSIVTGAEVARRLVTLIEAWA